MVKEVGPMNKRGVSSHAYRLAAANQYRLYSTLTQDSEFDSVNHSLVCYSNVLSYKACLGFLL